ncbi:MAG: hypothetical protein JWQ85_2256 [Mucilaginibacter sp.]|nr:hypothetical protein [Mucilaginibacter sp.]
MMRKNGDSYSLNGEQYSILSLIDFLTTEKTKKEPQSIHRLIATSVVSVQTSANSVVKINLTLLQISVPCIVLV